MPTRLQLEMLPQPDDTTCGPTCLHAVYRFYGDKIPLPRLINEVERLDNGGTLAVLLGCHALKRGYGATIYTFDLQVWDPTWFEEGVPLDEKLRAQMRYKRARKFQTATRGYLRYLELGGQIRFRDLSHGLIRQYLEAGKPVLAGLSSTFLYRQMREWGPMHADDDIRGEPAGHFVVLCGYDRKRRQVYVADPLQPNPPFHSRQYPVSLDRLTSAILLGILTYDAAILVIEPGERSPRRTSRGGARAKRS